MRRLHAHRSEAYTVSELCGLFGKSKQTYYKHDSNMDLRRMALEEIAVQYIREVKAKDSGIGGMKVRAMYCRTFSDRDRIGVTASAISSTATASKSVGAAESARPTPVTTIRRIPISPDRFLRVRGLKSCGYEIKLLTLR